MIKVVAKTLGDDYLHSVGIFLRGRIKVLVFYYYLDFNFKYKKKLFLSNILVFLQVKM